MNFVEKWEDKFGSIWDNKENTFPPEPYQPEYVSLRTDFKVTKRTVLEPQKSLNPYP